MSRGFGSAYEKGHGGLSKRKIAILGGGMGALSAAWAITEQPDWASRFEVTVYQRGWRLGGKAASGRNMDINGRIEEHGLHIWAGCFTQAITMMRNCYADLVALGLRQPDEVLGTFDKAFKPLNHLFVPEAIGQPDGSVTQEPWRITAASPATGDASALQPRDYLDKLLAVLAAMLAKAGGDATPISGALDSSSRNALLATAREWLEHSQSSAGAPEQPSLRRLLTLLDLGLAAARGMMNDEVIERGFDHLDHWEGQDWLARHGVSAAALESSVMTAAYGFAFGYPGSLSDARGVGAGTLVHNLCRLAFADSDVLFYKMQASAGDAVFAPLFQVLQARGVQFRFFHAVTGLGLSSDHATIDEIHLIRQAEPTRAYDPLVTVRNLPCWPSWPRWEQLRDGADLQAVQTNFEDESLPPTGSPVTLKRGEDFDEIVLGISIGALPEITRELAVASPNWAAMLSGLATVAVRTQQLWLTVPSAEYGWKQLVDAHNPGVPSGNSPLRTLASGQHGQMSTWVDVSDLLTRADWGTDDRPWSAAAFTCLLPEPASSKTYDEMLVDTANWLDSGLTQIWPNMQALEGGFLYATLHDPNGGAGRQRLDWQFTWSGIHGSARQVLSTPGTLDNRLAPDPSGFANLFLAGDWTRNGINAASAESAAASGFQAAAAIAGR